MDLVDDLSSAVLSKGRHLLGRHVLWYSLLLLSLGFLCIQVLKAVATAELTIDQTCHFQTIHSKF